MHSSQIAAQRRRANFFASSVLAPQGHDSSYQHLRAELGDENTNRLITNIGTLALSTGVEVSGVSLSDAVRRILGSLTPSERAAIASGNAPPPRVQALLDNELKLAQQQQRQAQLAAAKTEGPNSDLPGHGIRPLFGAALARTGYGGRGDYSGVASTSGSSSSYVSNPSSVTMLNYAGTPYAGTGMTYSTFSYLRNDLRSENFSGRNILHAGQDARRHGFNPNDRPVARDFAIVDRDDGARRAQTNDIYSRFDRELASDAQLQRLKQERDQAQTVEAKRALEAQILERAQTIAGKSGLADHILTAPTDAARGAHERNRDRFIQRHTDLQLEHQARIGDEAARRLNAEQRDAAALRVAPAERPAATLRRFSERTLASAQDDLLAAANPNAVGRDIAERRDAPDERTAATLQRSPERTLAAARDYLLAVANPTAVRGNAPVAPTTPATDVATSSPATTATTEQKKTEVKSVQTAAAKPITPGPKVG